LGVGQGEEKGLVSFAYTTCAGATIIVRQSDYRIPVDYIPGDKEGVRDIAMYWQCLLRNG